LIDYLVFPVFSRDAIFLLVILMLSISAWQPRGSGWHFIASCCWAMSVGVCRCCLAC